MKIAANLAGALLGLAFVFFSLAFFFNLMPAPPAPPANSPPAMFFGAFGPTGYMAFVKTIELLGGILVAIPKTRNIGLLFLGPVVVNIIAFHVFIGNRADLLQPPLVVIVLLASFLLWTGRKSFAGLLNS